MDIPLKQHAGAAATPLVTRGQQVTAGQLLGEISERALGACVHSSIDGQVTQVTKDYISIEGGRGGL